MSFLKRLFGGGGERSASGGPLGEETYKGFTIKAVEMRAGAEYQLAGSIEKEVDGEMKAYPFVRADRVASKDELIAMAFSKGRQIIDEQGDFLFSAAGRR